MHFERLSEVTGDGVVVREHCLVCGHNVLPPLTRDEHVLALQTARACDTGTLTAPLMRQYLHWCTARLAMAQWVAEEAIKQGQQLTLAGVGKDSENDA